jgi:dTDP-4-dehydrorhamnose reductase
MAHHCSERDTQFVHVSTDYVFDGKSDERYGEESDPNPIQVYGESKLEGDRGVLLAHRSPLLVRPSFVYGVNQTGEKPGLEGFPAWVRSQLVDSEEVPLLTDQYVTPSRAGATAETMLDLLEAGATGTYNVAARSCVTPYEFGWELVEQVAARESSLSRESQTDIKRSAARPTNTCLNVEKVESRLGRPQPTLGEDIASIASCL